MFFSTSCGGSVSSGCKKETPRCNTTAVQDRSTTTVESLIEDLGSDAALKSESWLTRQLSAAKKGADLYLNNPFLACDPDSCEPGAEEAIPDAVELGLVEYVRGYIIVTSGSVGRGVKSEKEGDLSVSYGGRDSVIDSTTNIPFTALNYWSSYRLAPFGG